MAAIALQPSPVIELTNLSAGQWVQFVHAHAHNSQPHLPNPFKVLSLSRSFQWMDLGRARMLDSSGCIHDYIPRKYELGDYQVAPFGLDPLWCCKAKVLTSEEAKKMLGIKTFEFLEKLVE